MNKSRNTIHFVFWLSLLAIAVCLIVFSNRWNAAAHSCEVRLTDAGIIENPAEDSRGRIFLDNDAGYWVDYAREMAATGRWRIRYTHFDNPPDGRPVHWSQAVSWLLLFMGHVRHVATGEQIHSAIENSAMWVGPLPLLILAVGTGYLIFRRLGLLPAMVWMFSLAALPPVQWTFHSMRPDHHGLHLGFVLAGLLCLILGGLGWFRTGEAEIFRPQWFKPFTLPNRCMARRFFVASGILGGLGIWTGATVQLFGTGLFAVGAILLVFFMPSRYSSPRENGTDYMPDLWRWWAMTGAATSFIFYLIEYAPSFPGMRLEVNHPLYAVSWVCAGELLTRLSAGKMHNAKMNHSVTVLFFLGSVLLPCLLYFGPAEWHAMRDPLMQRMHHFIDEFRPFLKLQQGSLWLNILMNFGFLPLFIVVTPWLAGEKQTTLYEWAALWMAFLPAMAYAALTLIQARWMSFLSGSSLLLAIITFVIFWRHQMQKARVSVWFWVLLVALAGQPIFFIGNQLREFHALGKPAALSTDILKPILQRQFAERLRASDSNTAFTVMCDPDLSPRLHYYGGIRGIVSYYWENLEGLEDASLFFAAENDQEAQHIARVRGITHIILPQSLNFARAFYYIRHGHLSENGINDSLAGRLLTDPDRVPSWIVRDIPLENSLQRGFLFAGQPVIGPYLVFTVQRDQLGESTP